MWYNLPRIFFPSLPHLGYLDGQVNLGNTIMKVHHLKINRHVLFLIILQYLLPLVRRNEEI